MSKQTRFRLFLVIVVLAVAGVTFYARSAARSRVDVNRIVTQAFSHGSDGHYVAQVTTETLYNGSSFKSSAVVFHEGKSEKIESNGAGRKIWSMTKNGKSYTYLPKGNKILVSQASRIVSDKEREKLLGKNYRAEYLGMDQVAGRSSYVLRIYSSHGGRPSKKLWVDTKTYTILQSIDYSADGKQRGSTKIEKIDFGAKIDPSRFALPKSANYVEVCRSGDSISLFEGIGFAVNAPRYLPEGYKLEGYHLFNCQCSCGHHSAQLTYTDGINIISVFQTPIMTDCAGCKMTKGGKSDGCVGASCGMAMNGQVNRSDKSIIVVGDLLPEDVRKIAESVE